jgi:hypothetical protein
MSAVLPLIGVVLGGVLTFGTQVFMGWLERRAKLRLAKEDVRVISRLQQDAFWTFQVLAAGALRGKEWVPAEFHARYSPSDADVRMMASVLPPEDWRTYAAAIRYQAECLSIDSGTHKDIMEDLLRAFMRAEEARFVLGEFSQVSPTRFSLDGLSMSKEAIDRVLASESRFRSDRAKEWAQRLTPNLPPAP